jgi:hypothetical protein
MWASGGGGRTRGEADATDVGGTTGAPDGGDISADRAAADPDVRFMNSWMAAAVCICDMPGSALDISCQGNCTMGWPTIWPGKPKPGNPAA